MLCILFKCFITIDVIGIVPINGKAVPGPIGCASVRARDGYQVALALQVSINNL